MGTDKFVQPADDVHIVERSSVRTLLNDETLAAGRARIAAGEDPGVVALELAKLELTLMAEWAGDTEEALLVTAAEFDPMRMLGDVAGHEFHGNQWTGSTGGGERFKNGTVQEGRVLNGVPLATEANPDFSQSINTSIHEPAFPDLPKGKTASAGVIMVEPDGRVWVYEPHGKYGGYKTTFSKGGIEENEHPQMAAAREAWEETGLVPQITGHLTDVERTTTVTRFYIGHRIGGAPWAAGKESHAVKLLDVHGNGIERALKNVWGGKTTDHKVLQKLRDRVPMRTLSNPEGINQYTAGGGAGKASRIAQDQSNTANRTGLRLDHVLAAVAHASAAEMHGKGSKAEHHTRMADLHRTIGKSRVVRAAGMHPEGAVHKAADANLKSMTVAVWYAFLKAQQAAKDGESAALTAMRDAMRKTLPRILLKTLVDGGNAAAEALPSLKAAGDVEGHEFHGNQWTSGHGGGEFGLSKLAAGKSFYEIDKPNNLFDHLSTADRETYLKDFRRMPEARKDGAVEQERSLTNLVSTQKSIEVAQVKELVRDPSLAENPDDGPPLIVTWHGRDVIGDGHHRIAAALLRGESKMHVEYVNLDSYLKKIRGAELRTLKPPVKKVGPIRMRFDAENEAAALWAEEHVAQLIEGVTLTTRTLIQDAVATAHRIGQVGEVYKTIRDAIGDKDRAQLIARTETMMAANEGQRQAWQQAVEEGLLPQNATVSWIATEVGACPECEELDGETRSLDGQYPGDVFPPLHPNCRCTEGIL